MKPEKKLINFHTADFDWDKRTFEEQIIIMNEYGKFIRAIRKKIKGI